MEQHFLTKEKLQKQEAERLPQQESVAEAEPKAALEVVNVLEPDGVVTPVTRQPHGQQLSVEQGRHPNLRGMTAHEREELLEQLTQQARAQQKRRRWSQIVSTISISLFIGLLVGSGYEWGNYGSPMKNLEFLVPPSFICYSIAGIYMNRASKLWSRALENMALFDDLRATGPLLEALDSPDKAVVASAEIALMRLLPRLQASDANSITELQRECLYRWLKRQNAQTLHGSNYLIAALRALEQVGDAKALPYVEALTASTSTSTNATRVREAATHCLAFLKARAEEQQWSNNLLRASSSQETPSDALLRPAVVSPPTDPQHLLRPSSPEN